MALPACGSGDVTSSTTKVAVSTPPGTPAAAATPSPEPTPTPTPPPPYPKYSIESLRLRSYVGGQLQLGAVVGSGYGWVRRQVTWPSGGQTMTGLIQLPNGPGPFPVVIVNHGFVPVGEYYEGQDTTKYADTLSSHGFITLAPNYPGYLGSGPGETDVPSIVATAISVIDLVSSVRTLPQADPSRIGMIGHSNGGGVGLLVMVIDPRVHAYVLFAPVSSDMADNARRWWARRPESVGPLGDPDANPLAYSFISPRNYFAPAGPPTLILQGTVDDNIPIEWTQATVAALAAKQVKVELVTFPGQGHNLIGNDLVRADALAEDWIRAALK
jgi:dipeptidyl aminopeptidase/acylaminoacyl peptidase